MFRAAWLCLLLLAVPAAAQEANLQAHPVYDPSALGGELMARWEVGYGVTDNAGAASAWSDRIAARRSAVQGTGGSQPTIAATELQFDGSADNLAEAAPTFTSSTVQQLPDASGNAGAGTAFSSTGLAYDWVTGGWVIGNDGRSTDPDASFEPSIVFVSADGATKTSEVVLTSIFTSMRSIQGVWVDPSDGHIWLASLTENLVRKVNRTTGASISSFALTGANGLIGQRDGTLWTHDGTTARHQQQDGTVISSFAASGDQLFYDEAHGWLWTLNGSALRIYDAVSGIALYANLSALTDMNYGEGVWYRTDTQTLTVIHNGSFHSTSGTPASPNRSQLRTYAVAGIDGALLAQPYVSVFWVGNANAYVSGTNTLFQFGTPLGGTSTDIRAFGIYLPSSTVTRLIINPAAASTTNQATANFTTVPTTRSVWSLLIDAVAETADLYRNGTLVSQQSISNFTGGQVYGQRFVAGAAIESGSAARHSSLRLSALLVRAGAAAIGTANRQKLEGYLAWRFGLQASLDASHPYLTNPP